MVKNLKSLRTQKGISQLQLAGVLGLSQQSINKYENHNIEPDISTLIALAEYFHTTIDYLVGRDDGKSEQQSETGTLSATEQALIHDYRGLKEAEKICVDTLIGTYKALAKKQRTD